MIQIIDTGVAKAVVDSHAFFMQKREGGNGGVAAEVDFTFGGEVTEVEFARAMLLDENGFAIT